MDEDRKSGIFVGGWTEQWIIERWLAPMGRIRPVGRWAHDVTIPESRSETEAFDRATDKGTGLLARDYGRTWRVREVGEVEERRMAGGVQ
jgi:hypothetical protein